MKKILLLLAVLALTFLPVIALGQVEPGPTPIPVVTTDTGVGVTLPSGALKIALAVLAQGLLVSKMIDGLKNTPFLADFFERHKWAGAVSNALVSFFVAAPLCFAATGHADLNCLAATVTTFLAAAGFHLARVKANTPAVVDATGVVRDAPSPSVSRKTLDDLGIKPVK